MQEYRFLQFPPEAVHIDPTNYGGMANSARKVFDLLRQQGPQTHAQIAAATGLPRRTIRFAVQRLRAQGLISRVASLHDCRICYFFIDRSCVDANAIAQARTQANQAVTHGLVMEAFAPQGPASAWSAGARSARATPARAP